jgi:hypothetical protein|tara:strand:- start:54 stop:641 length:588 start_codon:yes stop_codon:yes gene_type:complete
MKKLLVISTAFIMTLLSCGENKEEQMLSNYMNDNTIKTLNISAKDLGFKIINLKKVSEVTAKDSLVLMRNQFGDFAKTISEDSLFISEKEGEKLIYETKKAKTRNKTSKKLQQDIIDLIQEQIDTKKKYAEPRKIEFNKMSLRISELEMNTNEVLSHKYEVTYSMDMPDTNVTNTFRGYAYTNFDNTKFVTITDE